MVAACDRAPTAVAPTGPTLAAGTWTLSVADGQPLPALIAHEVVPDDGYLQTFADSATLIVTGDGRYEQRVWLRTLRHRDGLLLARPNLVDRGRWVATGETLALVSDYQAWRPASRVHLIDGRSAEIIETVGHDLGGLVVSRYVLR
jgi:hypothetical protein